MVTQLDELTYIRMFKRVWWKCQDSPTGAHHWYMGMEDTKWKCIHCGQEVKGFGHIIPTWDTAPAPRDVESVY